MNLNEDVIIREIEENDFENYMNLMYKFTNFKYDITKEQFISTLTNMKNNNLCSIIVLLKSTNIIGAGSIVNLIKLHNNSAGQIEDVIIDTKYRGLGYGKLIINNLVEIGKLKYNCYKIILNCINTNISFYKKCNFEIVGVEMKYVNT